MESQRKTKSVTTDELAAPSHWPPEIEGTSSEVMRFERLRVDRMRKGQVNALRRPCATSRIRRGTQA